MIFSSCYGRQFQGFENGTRQENMQPHRCDKIHVDRTAAALKLWGIHSQPENIIVMNVVSSSCPPCPCLLPGLFVLYSMPNSLIQDGGTGQGHLLKYIASDLLFFIY